MADLGQTEFQPLYGYFINNKTSSSKTLTFNYKSGLAPNEKLFERTFGSTGWYSIGVANAEYAKTVGSNAVDTNNPSQILGLLTGAYDLVVDFTDSLFPTNRDSVAVTDPWKVVVPADVNSLHDFRETKGYAIYIKNAGANYNGFQDELVPVIEEPGITTEFVSSSEVRTNGAIAGDADSVEFKIKFKVTALGDMDIHLDGDTVGAVATPTGINDGTTWATTTDSTTGTSTYVAIITADDGVSDDDLVIPGDRSYVIEPGTTRNFTFTVVIPTGVDNGAVGVRITSLKWDVDYGDSHANLYTTNISDMSTDTVTGLFIR